MAAADMLDNKRPTPRRGGWVTYRCPACLLSVEVRSLRAQVAHQCSSRRIGAAPVEFEQVEA